MRRRVLARVAAVTGSAGLAVAGLIAGAPGASALPAGCSQPSATVLTCTFTTPGQHDVAVPAATIGIRIHAVGGRGGDDGLGGAPGGVGAVVDVSLRSIPVAGVVAAGHLYAVVGGDGAAGQAPCTTSSAGGVNGGGAGGCIGELAGAGGGGASDVRIVPDGSSGPLANRLVVAAGGGGASNGGAGGAAGQAAAPFSGDPGRAGQPGTATGPGNNGYGTAPGALGVGGADLGGGGGGGGAGLYGGGGSNQSGAGGGGGSSLVPPGGSLTLAAATEAPSVTITFELRTLPVFTSTASAAFTTGQAGRFPVTATGNPAPTITESGALPRGVTFSDGALSGTPAAGTAGTYPITFTATNADASPTVQQFTLTVAPAATATSSAPPATPTTTSATPPPAPTPTPSSPPASTASLAQTGSAITPVLLAGLGLLLLGLLALAGARTRRTH